MAKKFVRDNYEYDTVSTRGDAVGRAATEILDCVTNDSIAKNLGMEVLSGADDDARTVTLVAGWGESGLTDVRQIAKRELLNLIAPIVTIVGRYVTPDSSSTASIHRDSYQTILPIGFSDGWVVMPTSDGNIANARDITSLKSLEVRHDNILKHSAATPSLAAAQAWDAHTAYHTDPSNPEVRKGYLINPTLDENGQPFSG